MHNTIFTPSLFHSPFTKYSAPHHPKHDTQIQQQQSLDVRQPCGDGVRRLPSYPIRPPNISTAVARFAAQRTFTHLTYTHTHTRLPPPHPPPQNKPPTYLIDTFFYNSSHKRMKRNMSSLNTKMPDRHFFILQFFRCLGFSRQVFPPNLSATKYFHQVFHPGSSTSSSTNFSHHAFRQGQALSIFYIPFLNTE